MFCLKMNLILRFLDYKRLRGLFRSSFQIYFTNLHPVCHWDKAMCRVIYNIWEVCQMFSCTQQFNDRICPYQRGRAYLLLTDFRISGKTN